MYKGTQTLLLPSSYRQAAQVCGAPAMEYFGAPENLKTIKLLLNYLFSVHQ